MTLLVVKILATVVMTHGVRAIGGRVGPRWSGLVMGLPSTTAVVLLFLGHERGLLFAVRTIEGAILGIVAAVALALAYAFAAGHRRTALGSLALGVTAYVAAASALGQMTSLGVPSRLAVALAGVALGSVVAKVFQVSGESTSIVSPSRARSQALRTILPVACLLTTTGLAGAVGKHQAGLLCTFPSTFVAVIVIVHLEAGPATAIRAARAFPRGNLSMIAFLAVVRLSAHRLGLAPAMGVGCLVALTTLFLMETFASRLFPALTTRKWAFDRPETISANIVPQSPGNRRRTWGSQEVTRSATTSMRCCRGAGCGRAGSKRLAEQITGGLSVLPMRDAEALRAGSAGIIHKTHYNM